jgi:hypothetical protein
VNSKQPKASFLMTTLMQGNMLRVYIEEKKGELQCKEKKQKRVY